MLDWLAGTAESLIAQAPGVAAELLARAVASPALAPASRDRLTALLADAMYRAGDMAGAEQVAASALEHTAEPDLLVDLLWTQTQVGMRGGSAAKSLSAVDQALAIPELSARNRARLFLLAARVYSSIGHRDQARRLADAALPLASAAGDSWATAWALHVATLLAPPLECIPLFDRALRACGTDPALTDLRFLLQINKSIQLAGLDEYQEALSAAVQARDLASQLGTAVRLHQTYSALAQLYFRVGEWDNALAAATATPAHLKESGSACTDHSIVAAICLHRGDTASARRNLAAAARYDEDLGDRACPANALARSLDYERAGALADALAALTEGLGRCSDGTEAEDMFGDAVRLASQTGDMATARRLADQAAALASESQLPSRQANTLYCHGLLDHDPALLLAAAGHYDAAGRPLRRAKAFEAAAREFLRAGDRGQARDAFTSAVDVYAALGDAADVSRLQAEFRAHGIRRGPHFSHRKATSGWESLTPTEEKIAGFVTAGLSNPEIAQTLILSRRTVATHVSSILRKLGVSSRTDIAREAALRAP